MSDITIPPEAVEAAARAIRETFRAETNMSNAPEWDASNPTLKDAYRKEARAALRAGLAAWPGGGEPPDLRAEPHHPPPAAGDAR